MTRRVGAPHVRATWTRSASADRSRPAAEKRLRQLSKDKRDAEAGQTLCLVRGGELLGQPDDIVENETVSEKSETGAKATQAVYDLRWQMRRFAAHRELVRAWCAGTELSALEEGHHAYYFAQRGEVGGRGKTGGLREYARRLNKSESSLRERRAAYHVYANCALSAQFGDSYKHLYEISKAPEDAWDALASAMVAASKPWTVKETAAKVGEVAKFQISDEHLAWLPRSQITDAYLTNGRPTPTAVARLVEEADRVLIAINGEKIATEKDVAEFRAWLVANTGGEAWDHRKISGYHAELIKAWAERRDEVDGGRIRIHECRASELLGMDDKLEPGAVDLIFTDPPYSVEFVECWTELGELAVKVLKPGGLLVAYTGQYTMPQALDRLRAAGLDYFWCYAIGLALEQRHQAGRPRWAVLTSSTVTATVLERHQVEARGMLALALERTRVLGHQVAALRGPCARGP